MDNYERVVGQASGKGKRFSLAAVIFCRLGLYDRQDNVGHLVEKRAVKKSKGGKQKKLEVEGR